MATAFEPHDPPRPAAAGSWRLLLGLFFTLAPTLASAQALDLDASLDAPKTRLLILSFVKPNSGSSGRQRRLLDRLAAADEGVRVITVMRADKRGRCADEGVSCDIGGQLAAQYGIDRYPRASLWSWRGELLVDDKSAEQVARRARAWLRAEGALRVEVLGGGDAATAKRRLQQLIVRQGKFTLAADQRKAKRRLQAALQGGELSLSLSERGRVLAKAGAPWDSDEPEESLEQALSALTAARRGETERPKAKLSRRWGGLVEPAPSAPAAQPAPVEAPKQLDWAEAKRVAEEEERRSFRPLSLQLGLGRRYFHHEGSLLVSLRLHAEYRFGDDPMKLAKVAVFGEIGLAAATSATLEQPIVVGPRFYLWKLYADLAIGLHTLGGVSDGEEESIGFVWNTIAAVRFGFAATRWELGVSFQGEYAQESSAASQSTKLRVHSSERVLYFSWRY